MSQTWCQEELETADLGDQRLNERFGQILESLALCPTASIPAALGGHAELEAAYRFCDNNKVPRKRFYNRIFTPPQNVVLNRKPSCVRKIPANATLLVRNNRSSEQAPLIQEADVEHFCT